MLTPHMEVLHKELVYVETLMKKDSQLSTYEGLVDLAKNLEIQVHSLDEACDNWDAALKIIMELHKPFLDRHIVSVRPK